MATKERTEQEIQDEIKWMRDNRSKIVRHNAFGGDNWAKLDAEIAVLQELLDEDDIYEKQDNGEWDEEQVEAAREALNWRDESDDEAQPSKSWSSLVGLAEPERLPPPIPMSSMSVTGKSGRVSVEKPTAKPAPKAAAKKGKK